MKILTLHSDSLEVEPKIKAIKDAPEVKLGEKLKFGESLVVFSAVEARDEKDAVKVAEQAASEIKAIADQVKVKRVVLYPYVHLTSSPASPSAARTILESIQKILGGKGFEVGAAPFGYYKQFLISVKGHPLAELSREIVLERKVGERPKIQESFSILGTDGKLHDPKDYKYKEGEEDFKVLVEKEALKKTLPGLPQGKEPEFMKAMRKFGIDWETMSDVGHMRWGPLGAMILELSADYARQKVDEVGIPVYHVRGTNAFNLAERPIAEHAKLFGERLYELDIEKKRFALRYAACFQQFAMMKDWTISYRNLPLGALEIADAYRFEQTGELLLGFRLRKMNMPDLHILCRDVEEAMKWSLKLHKIILGIFDELGYAMPCLYNLTRSFYENNKDFFKELLKIEKKPLLLRFIPEKIYYWVINVEHHVVDKMAHPREIGTWQIDIGNAERFGIRFMDKDNTLKYPTIIHTALVGTLERFIFAAFDAALRKKNPTLPMWLSPVQVRLCPINESFNSYAEKVADQLAAQNVRVDVDDRVESVQKKIRDAEVDWVNAIVVVGPKEKKSKKLAVRFREDGKVKQMTTAQLVKFVQKETAGKPFRQLPLPRLLSVRPKF